MPKDRNAALAVTGEIPQRLVEENRRLRVALERCEGQLASAMQVIEALEAHRERELHLHGEIHAELLRELGALALKDGLTGLYNRRYFEDALPNRLLLCRRLNLPLSLLYIDVDHFKRFNDLAGHTAGDALLRHLGRLLDVETGDTAVGRRSDVVARIGGEEFVMILIGADASGARMCAERLRRRIRTGLGTMTPAAVPGPVTVTIGVATFPSDAEDAAGLVQQADAALLRGKRSGRNRVRCAADGRSP
jgi:diguanylate cyclase (GGDEF)-like protein